MSTLPSSESAGRRAFNREEHRRKGHPQSCPGNLASHGCSKPAGGGNEGTESQQTSRFLSQSRSRSTSSSSTPRITSPSEISVPTGEATAPSQALFSQPLSVSTSYQLALTSDIPSPLSSMDIGQSSLPSTPPSVYTANSTPPNNSSTTDPAASPSNALSSQFLTRHRANAGAIMGGVIGGVVLLAILVVALFAVRRARRKHIAPSAEFRARDVATAVNHPFYTVEKM